MELQRAHSFHGEISIPGDKSISHRGVMFGAISDGITEITNFLQGSDCLSTISCFQKLGISTENTGSKVIVHGKGLHGLKASASPLDVGNSGTTARLISGILAGQDFSSTLTGDASIQKRPMKRIFTPLSQMGAVFESQHQNDCAPFTISRPNEKLQSIHYQSPIASAQVKSAILLAGLYADGPVCVTEPIRSRNHTELMLSGFGAKIRCDETTACIEPNPHLEGQKIQVPGDISSAAYFIALGLITPNSEILIKNVGVNPTRNGIIQTALAMGGKLTLLNEHTVSGEPAADILVRSSVLHGTIVEGSLIPTLIDEIPVIAIMAAFAKGTTIISNAQELLVKESNRIASITENLSRMGCDITPTEDGMIICGEKPLHGCCIKTYDDHRIAMAFAVAALNADGVTTFDNQDCVTISYPSFYRDIHRLKDK